MGELNKIVDELTRLGSMAGPPGVTGPTGPAGTGAGATGPTGPTGAGVAGPTGPTGVGLPSFVSTDSLTYLSIDSSDAQTRRMLFASHEPTDSSGSCEFARVTLTKRAGDTSNASKGAIAWYLGEDTTPGHAIAWLQAHSYLDPAVGDVGNNRHDHISIETSNAAGTSVNTRFAVGWGQDLVQASFFGAELNVVANKFRVTGSAGSSRVIELANTLSSNRTPDTSHQRLQLLANATAEGGANAGSDFELRNYSDTGVALSTGLFMKRSNGFVGLLGQTVPTQALDIGTTGTVGARLNRGATTNSAAFLFATGGTDQWTIRLTNDSTDDLHIRNVNNGVTAILAERRATQANLTLLDGTKSYGGGVGVVRLAPASTAPTSAPSTGMLFWYDGTSFKVWRAGAGAAQTVTIV